MPLIGSTDRSTRFLGDKDPSKDLPVPEYLLGPFKRKKPREGAIGLSNDLLRCVNLVTCRSRPIDQQSPAQCSLFWKTLSRSATRLAPLLSLIVTESLWPVKTTIITRLILFHLRWNVHFCLPFRRQTKLRSVHVFLFARQIFCRFRRDARELRSFYRRSSENTRLSYNETSWKWSCRDF